jgi:hypothetical protein
MSNAKTLAKEHGLTLADVAELIAPPKPRKWADLDDRTDEVRAALDEPRTVVEGDTLPAEPEPYVAPAPVGELTDHKQPGRRVTAWFVRQ